MRSSDYENQLQQRDETIQRQAEIVGLKKLLVTKARAKSAKKPTFTQNYSLEKTKR